MAVVQVTMDVHKLRGLYDLPDDCLVATLRLIASARDVCAVAQVCLQMCLLQMCLLS